ncbi:alginate lyase family protein [Paraglaciecola sp. 2405UD69-4]|uniref:alginate lyase family protein n=1 Tax=Paraglaciecola sp. 2405UD69-4 TaxID=3391836 RepID=UPI0039C96E32
MHFYTAVMGIIFSISSFTLIAGPLVVLEQADLNFVKTAIQEAKAPVDIQRAYTRLIQQADEALLLDGYSVVDKTILPPSNNRHDYLSISRYWWPDNSKSDGLPWVRRDGVTNPDTQTDQVDRKRLGGMSKSVHILALAYFLSGDEKYAQKGVSFIKRWFLEDDTKMNPHLEFAQSVPGIDKRRRSGILDGRLIPEKMLDSITLFSASPWWSAKDNEDMNQWLSEYLSWLTTSKIGKAGAKQTNNHGSWYYFQVTALSWYLGDTSSLRQALEHTQSHMMQQFDEQGAQHHELARTRPFFYSCFNLEALTSIAKIANKVDINLWQYPSAETSVLTTAVDYLIPAAKGEPWRHGKSPIKATDLIDVLYRYNQYSDGEPQKALFNELVSNIKNDKADSYSRFILLHPNILSE